MRLSRLSDSFANNIKAKRPKPRRYQPRGISSKFAGVVWVSRQEDWNDYQLGAATIQKLLIAFIE
ncbi:hypothetical protein SBDP1_340025 [Syntrophobacter sp. SbD1]|nr:hypothetical protein SBDP1_340025 [Syntrophobacter sp. SbD1]